MTNAATPEYDLRLSEILRSRDWQALRDFSRTQNEIPEEIYAQDQHFWEVLVHKLTCSRLDLLALHDESRAWLEEHGYSTDLGGY